MTEHFEALEDAEDYVRAHDADAGSLDREKPAWLRHLYEKAVKDAGQIRLMGGPVSKDELISSILELRYPRIAEARGVIAGAAVAEWAGRQVERPPRQLTKSERNHARHLLQALIETARAARDAIEPETGMLAVTDQAWERQWVQLKADLDLFTSDVMPKGKR
jgi:hypothetical protein